MTRAFDFRTLSQNRRVVEDDTRKPELDKFHEALTSISEGTPDEVVRQFFVDCFVRGARVSAENVDFEGSTAVLASFIPKWALPKRAFAFINAATRAFQDN